MVLRIIVLKEMIAAMCRKMMNLRLNGLHTLNLMIEFTLLRLPIVVVVKLATSKEQLRTLSIKSPMSQS